MADAPIVLVHGALQTADTWDLVAPLLVRAGRCVVIARLTGLEGDASALTEAVTLDTHIHDVVELLEREDLSDVILVGHSYAGMIITGAAEHARDRIAHLAYVDALVPEHGQSAMDILPEPTRNTFRALAAEGGGWRLRPSCGHGVHSAGPAPNSQMGRSSTCPNPAGQSFANSSAVASSAASTR